MIVQFPDTLEKKCQRSLAALTMLSLGASDYVRYDFQRILGKSPDQLKRFGEYFGWTDVQIDKMEGMRNED